MVSELITSYILDINFYVLIFVLGVFLISGLDDLFIDIVAYTKKCFPEKLTTEQLHRLVKLKERPIAIMIPAWDEGSVIEATLLGNLSKINYKNYHIFVGVYPNDPATLNAVNRVSKQHKNVHAIVNSLPGPTNKGQMLNLVTEIIFKTESKLKVRFSGVLMQDSEDVIHPLILKLGNKVLRRADFVQTPVFSLPLKFKYLTGGTYKDEFAELHTKDLLVRSRLNAGVPSAGVGTFLSRRLCKRLLGENDRIFPRDSLTEDYELGLGSSFSGLKTEFICISFTNPMTEQKEFIATREYFPKRAGHAIRQKTRWNTGIIFQGWQHLGWKGSNWSKYFLLRDRKGLLTHIVTFLGYLSLLSTTLILNAGFDPILLSPQGKEVFWQLSYLCLFLTVNRVLQRIICTHRIYGIWSTFGIPLRLPLSSVINFCALLRAAHQYTKARLLETKLEWSKTEHEIPAEFVTKTKALHSS